MFPRQGHPTVHLPLGKGGTDIAMEGIWTELSREINGRFSHHCSERLVGQVGRCHFSYQLTPAGFLIVGHAEVQA